MKKIDTTVKYKDTEQWVRKSGNHFLVGITDFTQKVFGNVVLVEFPTIGSHFKTDEQYAIIESDKTSSEVFMPISGTVIETNDELLQHPENINNLPYQSWLVKIEITNQSEYEALDSSEVYAESIRLFFNKG